MVSAEVALFKSWCTVDTDKGLRSSSLNAVKAEKTYVNDRCGGKMKYFNVHLTSYGLYFWFNNRGWVGYIFSSRHTFNLFKKNVEINSVLTLGSCSQFLIAEDCDHLYHQSFKLQMTASGLGKHANLRVLRAVNHYSQLFSNSILFNSFNQILFYCLHL